MTTKERPILFSGPMVRALLDGRKTQTRRVVKPQPSKLWGQGVMQSGPKRGRFCAHAAFEGADARADMYIPSPYGVPGDRLWVRETWAPAEAPTRDGDTVDYALYRADPMYDSMQPGDFGWSWKPSIHMPRWASRLTLELTDVRVERVQDISEEDAKAEGAECLYLRVPTLSAMRHGHGGWMHEPSKSHRGGFAFLWDSINTKRGYGWDANPFCWALTFRVLDAAESRRILAGNVSEGET